MGHHPYAAYFVLKQLIQRQFRKIIPHIFRVTCVPICENKHTQPSLLHRRRRPQKRRYWLASAAVRTDRKMFLACGSGSKIHQDLCQYASQTTTPRPHHHGRVNTKTDLAYAHTINEGFSPRGEPSLPLQNPYRPNGTEQITKKMQQCRVRHTR